MEAVARRAIRDELREALADERALAREADTARLVPLDAAARHYGITPKALRNRIERGSIDGASKLGGRWHVPLGTLPGPEDP